MRPDLSELVAALSLTALVTTGCPAQSKSPTAPVQGTGAQGQAMCANAPGKTSAPAANASCSGDSCAAAPDTKTLDAQAVGAKTSAAGTQSAPAAPASQPAKSGTSACAGDSGCASGDSKCASDDSKTTKPE